MSILTQMVLIEKHGLRVDLEGLGTILDTTPANLRRRISEGTLTIPTYVDGGRRWADVRDVAEYLDAMRASARGANPQAAGLRSA
jgi:hypothetical protein